jgi:uncharacterized damage-inducible protein DinB
MRASFQVISMSNCDPWLASTLEVVDSYRRMIDAAVEQLDDEELHRHPADGVNSVAVILRHLGGNLRSRWTDFLATDGEKPTRNRDSEFEDWTGERASLLEYFDTAWRTMRASLAALSADDLTTMVTIRGEPHTVQLAIERSITHTAYHVGQIMLVSRLVHSGDWKWLTIPPGGSAQHNQKTWGTSASRGMFGENKELPKQDGAPWPPSTARPVSEENSPAFVTLSSDELALLNNALNELLHGVRVDEPEFATRLGATREEAATVLNRLNRLCEQDAR